MRVLVFIIFKWVPVLLFLLFMGLVGFFWKIEKSPDPYNNLLQKGSDFANILADREAFREDLQKFLQNPLRFLLYFLIFSFLVIYRVICSILAFFWVFIYIIRIFFWKKSKSLSHIAIHERKFKNIFEIKPLFLFFHLIPECVGFTLVYVCLRSLLETRPRINILKFLQIFFINFILGTSVWNVVISVILTKRVISVFVPKANLKYNFNQLRNLLLNIFLFEINLTIEFAKELRIYKKNNKIRFNPNDDWESKSASIVGKNTKINKKLTTLMTVYKVYSNNFHHSALNFNTLDSDAIPEQLTLVQGTGKAIKGSEFVIVKAVDYKNSNSYFMYNIIQTAKNVQINHTHHLLQMSGLNSIYKQQCFFNVITANRICNSNSLIYETPNGIVLTYTHNQKSMARGIFSFQQHFATYPIYQQFPFSELFVKQQEDLISASQNLTAAEFIHLSGLVNRFPQIINYHERVVLYWVEDLNYLINERAKITELQLYKHFLF
jgi:hypothetical protein